MMLQIATDDSRHYLAPQTGEAMVHINTPAMPLTEAHFGGFFVSGELA